MKNKWEKGRGALSIGQRKALGLQAMFNRGRSSLPSVPTPATNLTSPTEDRPQEPPDANAGVDQSVASGALVILDGSGSQSNDGTLTYSWSQVSGPATSISDSGSSQPSFTAQTVGSSTQISFQLTVTNSLSLTDSDTVLILVGPPPNTAPTANAGTDQSVSSGAAVTLDGTGSTDPENNPLTYDWSQTAGNTVSLSSKLVAQPTFTASYAAAQVVLTFRLIVNDGQLSSSQDSVDITVGPVPAPTANAGPNQVVPSNTLVTLNGSGSSDPNGLSLTYAWSQVSGTAIVLSDASNVGPTFTSYSASVTADVVMGLAVYNGFVSSTSDTVVLTVNPPPAAGNSPPVSNAGPDQSVSSGAAVTLTGAGSSDPDGNPLTYAWSQTAGTVVTLSSAIVSQPTFTAPTLSADASSVTLQFRLTVNDGITAGSADTVSVVVLPPTTASRAVGVYYSRPPATKESAYVSSIGRFPDVYRENFGDLYSGTNAAINGNWAIWLNPNLQYGYGSNWGSWLVSHPFRRFFWMVGLCPYEGAKSSSAAGNMLDNVAAGEHDSKWQAFADYAFNNNLGGTAASPVYIALGWEMDGQWFAWGVGNNSTKMTNFKNAWRQVVTVMRARQPTANWKFCFCPTARGYKNYGITWAEAIYPGDDVVDLVGSDFYDSGTGFYSVPPTTAQKTTAWNSFHLPSLQVQNTLATNHNKKQFWGEWALVHDKVGNSPGGDDNPLFIQNSYDWYLDHDFEFVCYFNANNSSYDHSLTTFGVVPFTNSRTTFLNTFAARPHPWE